MYVKTENDIYNYGNILGNIEHSRLRSQSEEYTEQT